MADFPNICNSVHLPAQSGANAVLDRMGRGYTVEAYLEVVEEIRQTLGPAATISSGTGRRPTCSHTAPLARGCALGLSPPPRCRPLADFISGFCGETEAEHEATLRLMEQVEYDQCFMFAYSERPQTRAHRRFEDDVPEPTKQRRLREVIDTFRATVQARASQRGPFGHSPPPSAHHSHHAAFM